MTTLPRRAWKDGIELSILAMGGIVICGMPQEESSRRVAEAYERGVNYFDCAPTYFNGEAETKLGEALRPYRNKVFLAEKTTMRDAKGARVELEQTLATVSHRSCGPVPVSCGEFDGRREQDPGSGRSGGIVSCGEERG